MAAPAATVPVAASCTSSIFEARLEDATASTDPPLDPPPAPPPAASPPTLAHRLPPQLVSSAPQLAGISSLRKQMLAEMSAPPAKIAEMSALQAEIAEMAARKQMIAEMSARLQDTWRAGVEPQWPSAASSRPTRRRARGRCRSGPCQARGRALQRRE